MAQLALGRADLTVAAVHIEEMARQAAEFGIAHLVAAAQQLRARMHLQAGQWDAAERDAGAAVAGFKAASDVVNALKCRSLQADALWRGAQTDAAVAIWQETATALRQRGDESGARAVRLRLADSQAGSGQADKIDAARHAVLAKLPALQERDTLATAEPQQHLNDFSDPEVRQRVRHTVPWHRDVVEALAQSNAAA